MRCLALLAVLFFMLVQAGGGSGVVELLGWIQLGVVPVRDPGPQLDRIAAIGGGQQVVRDTVPVPQPQGLTVADLEHGRRHFRPARVRPHPAPDEVILGPDAVREAPAEQVAHVNHAWDQ